MRRLAASIHIALAVSVRASAAFAVAIACSTAALHAASQPDVPAAEQQALRARIEQRYDVVPLSSGLALRPKSPRGGVRLIEISDTIAIIAAPLANLSQVSCRARRASRAPTSPGGR